MSWWMSSGFRNLMAVLCLAGGACSGGGDDGDEGGSVADAGVDAGVSCEVSGSGGTPFAMSVGVVSGENEYTELLDGDPAEVVLGFQGLYMLQLEPRATLPVSSQSICLLCDVDVSAATSGPFDGEKLSSTVTFNVMPQGTFRGTFRIVLGSGSQRAALLGAEVELTMSCSGYGFSGTVERTIVLMPE